MNTKKFEELLMAALLMLPLGMSAQSNVTGAIDDYYGDGAACDVRGHVKKVMTYDTFESGDTNNSEREFDRKGHTFKNSTSKDGDIEWRNEIERDNFGRVTTIYLNSFYKGEPGSNNSITYEYNSKGWVETYTECCGAGGRVKYGHDSNGYVTKVMWDNWSTIKLLETYTYSKFDSHGNWLVRKSSDGKKSERVIEYWDEDNETKTQRQSGSRTALEIEDRVKKTIQSSKDNQLPSFKGGTEAYKSFLKENLHFPSSVLEQGVEEIVKLRFAIDVDGALSDFEILESTNHVLDSEVLRVARLMPNWNPQRENGKAIKTFIAISVSIATAGTTNIATKPHTYVDDFDMIKPDKEIVDSDINFTSDDLVFFETHGHVKSLKMESINNKMRTFYFNETGSLMSVDNRTLDEEIPYEEWDFPRITYGEDGRISFIRSIDSSLDYSWKNGKPVRVEGGGEGGYYFEEVRQFDDKGRLIKVEGVSGDEEGETDEYTINYNYTDEDDHGNWTKRIVKMSDGSSKQELRVITYYK